LVRSVPILLGGRLGDLLGWRRILLAGLTLFSGASLLAGLAQSQGLLIGARAVQGFGAALVAPAALSILAVTFAEGRERNWALGIFGAVGGSSASVGVIASGLLTDGPGWRWVFLINVPIGVLLIALAARFLPAHQAAAGSGRFDALGAGVVTAGLLLVYGLNRGVDHGWSSPPTLACFVGLPDSHRPGVAGDVAHGVRRRRDRGGPARLGGRRPVAPGRGDAGACCDRDRDRPHGSFGANRGIAGCGRLGRWSRLVVWCGGGAIRWPGLRMDT
jgi:Major Facilitator Superfamily